MKRALNILALAFTLVVTHAHTALADLVDPTPEPLDEPGAPIGITIFAVAVAIAAVVGILSRRRK